jgi:hypothetical protein
LQRIASLPLINTHVLCFTWQAYLQARNLAQESGVREQVADINASLAIVAYCSGEADTARQLLFQAVAEPKLCPPALFIMAALGLAGQDPTLTQAALGEVTIETFFGSVDLPFE